MVNKRLGLLGAAIRTAWAFDAQIVREVERGRLPLINH
jgi:hypothetical protein